MAYAAGVDVGSTQTKAVIIDEDGRIVGRALTDTGANVIGRRRTPFRRRSKSADLREEEVEYVIGTGYGRYKVTFGNTQVTEISCHGARRRAHVPGHPHRRGHGWPGYEGDQRVGDRGDRRLLHERQVRGGHGRFLGAASARSTFPSSELGPTALGASAREDQYHLHGVRRIRGAVLAREGQEDRGHPARRTPVHRGAIGGLLRASGIEIEVTFTGGVARNTAMIDAPERRLGWRVNVSDESHFMGALGAALFALDHILASRAGGAGGGHHDVHERESTSARPTPRRHPR